MTNGTAAAAIVSDAFLGRSNPWARLFIHTAWTLFPAAKKVVAENWFGDRLRYPKLNNLPSSPLERRAWSGGS
ncbi:MAG: hypothetical protein ACREV3_08760 [Gammaproteobacteria bacterium]